MKTQAGWAAALFAAMALPVHADIVSKTVKSVNGQVSTGYVLQGSHKMRGLGKRKTSVSVVPRVQVISGSGVSVSTPAVIPVLQNSQVRAKPRFGYGSDYKKQGGNQGGQKVAPPVSAAPVVPVVPQVTTTVPVLRAQPVYTYFHRPREYYPVWGGRVSYGYGGWYGSTRFHGHSCRPSVRLSYRNAPFAFSFGW